MSVYFIHREKKKVKQKQNQLVMPQKAEKIEIQQETDRVRRDESLEKP